MSSNAPENRIFEFGPFRVNPQDGSLTRDGIEIPLAPKVFDTLVVLLQHRGRVLSKDDLMKLIWGDTIVEESNVATNISLIRKALEDEASAPQYIENIPKRGYRFIAQVREVDPSTGATVNPGTGRRKAWIAMSLAVVLTATVLLTWYCRTGKRPAIARTEINSPADVAEVKNVVRESQIYETLSLYENPNSFTDEQLNKYWLPAELGGKEIVEVKAAIGRLRREGKYYGKESKLERFEFTYVRVFAPGNAAEAGTIEKWYVPLYQNDQLVTNRNVYLGPYLVDYALRKANGVWLLEKTTTPRPPEKQE
jgi:DNA-binding winged helix-turn-helix (wHTH) protein